MQTEIKMTVGEKVYQPGDIVAAELSKADKEFLLKEGYLSEKKQTAKDKAKSDTGSKKPSEKAESREQNLADTAKESGADGKEK